MEVDRERPPAAFRLDRQRAERTLPVQLFVRLPVAATAMGAGLLMLVIWGLARWADAKAPPGSDGGNWLAFAWQLSGDHVKAANSIYAPVFPFLLRLLTWSLDPLTAVKLLGVVSWVFMGVPFYLIVRRELHPLISITVTFAFLMAGYQAETLAFGGYPQLLGTALLLFSLRWLGSALVERKSRLVLFSAVAGALVIGTHPLAGAQLVAAALVLVGCYTIKNLFAWRSIVSTFARWTVTMAALSTVFAPFYFRMVRLLAGNPANPHGNSLAELDKTLSYVYSEQLGLWLLLTVVALVAVPLMLWAHRGSLLAPTAGAALFGPALLFAISGEVRNLQLMEAGVLMSVALLASYVMDTTHTISVNRNWRRSSFLAVAIICGLMAVAISWSGYGRAGRSFTFYRVIDNEAVNALDWLHRQGGGIVVAGPSPQGGIYGWWIEGYARRPAYNACDPRWFNFRQEKEQVALANKLLSGDLAAKDVSTLVTEQGIGYVFLDKQSPTDISNLEAAGFEPEYESARYLILGWTSAVQVEHAGSTTLQ